jgi:hypothetical protein
MGKSQNDAMLDAALDYVADSDKLIVCSSQPTTYTEAVTTYALADVNMAGGDFAKANGDTSGRKLTVGAKSGVTIDASGDAEHIALVKTGASELKYVTTCTSQTLTAGGTVDVPAWDIEIADAA